MKFSRPDYNNHVFFGDEFLRKMGQDPDEEPAFILKGRDYFAPIICRIYAAMISDHPRADKRLANTALETAVEMESYQVKNGYKFPDMPGMPERYDLHKMRSESLDNMAKELVRKAQDEIKRKNLEPQEKEVNQKDSAGENITPLRPGKNQAGNMGSPKGKA